ncbi:MAG: prepilin-type N-terminal cleavage/methylation domain-containing protein [Deltaproteobacteria bacterium]|nr:prepilin-type N-terminal cleavage/methylation domain-containing protein [Deltaproteobacteria bacterium]
MKDKKGFSLVELMVVVAIIGILAAIAVPNFLNYQRKSKLSEVRANLGGIRTAEIAYNVETSLYLNAAETPPRSLGTTPGSSTTLWPTSGAGTGAFGAIGWAPTGDVYCTYQVTGASATAFLATGTCDADGDSVLSTFTIAPNTQISQTSAAGIY